MNLQMKPESTLTRHVSRPSEPEGTQDGGVERHFPPREEFLSGGQTLDIPLPDSPPEHLLLDVVMTFAEGAVRLDAPGVGVSVEGDRIQEAFRRLVAAVEDYVASANGEEANLAHYASHTWFRFVPPDQARGQRLEADFWPEGESVEDFIEAATEGRYEEDEPDS